MNLPDHVVNPQKFGFSQRGYDGVLTTFAINLHDFHPGIEGNLGFVKDHLQRF